MTLVVDSSAIIAIALNEPERGAFVMAIAAAPDRRVSVAGLQECTMKAGRDRTGRALEVMDRVIESLRLTGEAIDLEQLAIARAAFLKFGKGRGHPAQLNFGDCFSYALAKSLNAPLLFKGEDFAQTDVKNALSGGARA